MAEERCFTPLHRLLSFDAVNDPEINKQSLDDLLARATVDHSGPVSFSVTLKSPVPRPDSEVLLQTSRTCTPTASTSEIYCRNSHYKAEDVLDVLIRWSESNPTSKSNSRSNSQMKAPSSMQGSVFASELNAKICASFEVPGLTENTSTQNGVQATNMPTIDDDCDIFDSVDLIPENIDPIPAKETSIQMRDLGNGQYQLTLFPETANAREVLQRRYDFLQLVRRTMLQARHTA
jgi:hypothetical protein